MDKDIGRGGFFQSEEPLDRKLQVLLSASEFNKMVKISKEYNRTLSNIGRIMILEWMEKHKEEKKGDDI